MSNSFEICDGLYVSSKKIVRQMIKEILESIKDGVMAYESEDLDCIERFKDFTDKNNLGKVYGLIFLEDGKLMRYQTEDVYLRNPEAYEKTVYSADSEDVMKFQTVQNLIKLYNL